MVNPLVLAAALAGAEGGVDWSAAFAPKPAPPVVAAAPARPVKAFGCSCDATPPASVVSCACPEKVRECRCPAPSPVVAPVVKPAPSPAQAPPPVAAAPVQVAQPPVAYYYEQPAYYAAPSYAPACAGGSCARPGFFGRLFGRR